MSQEKELDDHSPYLAGLEEETKSEIIDPCIIGDSRQPRGTGCS